MNDQIYKNWRKDVGTDYETTRRLVDEDYTRANISRNTEDELVEMNKKLTGATAMKYTLYIRRGQLINDDPQRRCYNGCFFKSHIEWSDWEMWLKDYFFTTEEAAQHAANQFKRENQEFKVVEVSE